MKRQHMKRCQWRHWNVLPVAVLLSVLMSLPIYVAVAYGKVNGNVDKEVDGDLDNSLNKGMWPKEYAVPLPLSIVTAATAVGKRIMTMSLNSRAVLRIMPEMVQHVIGKGRWQMGFRI